MPVRQQPVVHHIPVCPFSQRLEILMELKGARNAVDFTVVDVTRLSTDRLEQMRHWLMEAAQPKELPAHPDIDVRSS